LDFVNFGFFWLIAGSSYLLGDLPNRLYTAAQAHGRTRALGRTGVFTCMRTPRLNPTPVPITIEAHLEPTARWYLVSDMDEDHLCSFELDAYVIGFDEPVCPDGLDIMFIVLIASGIEQPHFLYAPNDLPGRILTDVAAIKLALEAYRAAHPGVIPALDNAPELEPEG
jgi:hypothetical protein